MKTCTECGEAKPLEDFHASSSKCKPCKREYMRQRYHERASGALSEKEQTRIRRQENNLRWCSGCQAEKPADEFPKSKARHCKPCYAEYHRNYRAANPEKHREGWVRRTYGISTEEYEEMRAAQNGVCAICGQEDPSGPLAIDHDHETGRVRGLLCKPCNRALGTFKDDPARLNAAIQYLSRSAVRGEA